MKQRLANLEHHSPTAQPAEPDNINTDGAATPPSKKGTRIDPSTSEYTVEMTCSAYKPHEETRNQWLGTSCSNLSLFWVIGKGPHSGIYTRTNILTGHSLAVNPPLNDTEDLDRDKDLRLAMPRGSCKFERTIAGKDYQGTSHDEMVPVDKMRLATDNLYIQEDKSME
eukprot:5949896-Ditylum_brightwellii.AAC.2